jgi:acetyl esterase
MQPGFYAQCSGMLREINEMIQMRALGKAARHEEFANGPWLTRAAMAWFWDAYAPNKEDRKKTTASPLSATLEQLKGLPPALVIVDENDILRDEGEQYARKLIQAGVG